MNDDLMYGLASVVAVFFGGMIVFVPVLALALRFALRPALETWLRMRQPPPPSPDLAVLERRLSLLESELQQVQHTMQALAEAQEFQRQLAAPPQGAGHRG